MSLLRACSVEVSQNTAQGEDSNLPEDPKAGLETCNEGVEEGVAIGGGVVEGGEEGGISAWAAGWCSQHGKTSRAMPPARRPARSICRLTNSPMRDKCRYQTLGAAM